MNEKELKQIIAKNIAAYRKANGMTQAELASSLNYSDKSISKWERAEGLPDIYVLTLIAEQFGVTLNDLVSEHIELPDETDQTDNTSKGLFGYLHNRIFVTILSAGLVWLAASILFFFLKLFLPDNDKLWLIFFFAIPVTFIVFIVFTALWSDNLFQLVSVSGLVWSLAVGIDLTVPLENVIFIYIIAAVLQVLALLWYIMRIWNRRIEKASPRQ